MTDENRAVNVQEEWGTALLCWREAELLANSGLWGGTMSRAYYGMFHAARALAFSLGLEVKTHSGLASVLSMQLVKPGAFPAAQVRSLSQMQRLREDADYHTLAIFDRQAADDVLLRLREFLAASHHYLIASGIFQPPPLPWEHAD